MEAVQGLNEWVGVMKKNKTNMKQYGEVFGLEGCMYTAEGREKEREGGMRSVRRFKCSFVPAVLCIDVCVVIRVSVKKPPLQIEVLSVY